MPPSGNFFFFLTCTKDRTFQSNTHRYIYNVFMSIQTRGVHAVQIEIQKIQVFRVSGLDFGLNFASGEDVKRFMGGGPLYAHRLASHMHTQFTLISAIQ